MSRHVRGSTGFCIGLISTSLALACNKASPTPPAADSAATPAASAPSAPTNVGASASAVASVTPEPVKPAGPLNVLLITIDSLRADMPWTGYSRPIAPYLTALSEHATVYTRAYSASSYTAKSVATLMTGRFPSTLYRDGLFFAKYSAANVFLAEILSERGIHTLGWHSHLYFAHGKGLDQGFSDWRLVPGIAFDPETDNNITSDKMTALGEEMLGSAKNTSGQFFAWAHYMDPHDQYQKHSESPDFGKKNRDRYDSEVWFTDFWLGKLIDWAKTQPWWSRTVLIVSADHGEAFGEHGMYKHAFEIWENLIRVPLLVTGPGIQARRIDERRSCIDVAPTILDLLGVPVPADFQGRSLVAELRGAAPESREPILADLSEDSHNPHRRALIEGDLKIIDFGHSKYELFDIKQDPGELTDLAATRKDDFARMRSLIEAKFGALPIVEPYGGTKLHDGGIARGPVGPAK